MVREISELKTTCGDTMWNSLNWVVISFEKELEVTTSRFDQCAMIVDQHPKTPELKINLRKFGEKIIIQTN